MTVSFSVNWSVFMYICWDLDQAARKKPLDYRSKAIGYCSFFFTLKNISVSDSLELNSKVIDHGLCYSNFNLSVEKFCYV